MYSYQHISSGLNADQQLLVPTVTRFLAFKLKKRQGQNQGKKILLACKKSRFLVHQRLISVCIWGRYYVWWPLGDNPYKIINPSLPLYCSGSFLVWQDKQLLFIIGTHWNLKNYVFSTWWNWHMTLTFELISDIRSLSVSIIQLLESWITDRRTDRHNRHNRLNGHNRHIFQSRPLIQEGMIDIDLIK